MKTAALLGVLLCGFASLAAAQSTISTTDKFAYAANAGWIDFRSSAADGVVVSESFLSGKAYAANTDPKDPSNLLRITRHEYYDSHSIVTLTFTSSSNRLYTIEHDADLVGTWADSGLALFAPDPGATSARTIRFAPGPRRFFRVLAHLPLQP